MTGIQPTSLAAYAAEVRPTLGERQARVLEAFKRHPDLTNNELASVLGWQINRITPRTNELVKRGLVEEAGKRACRVTGRTAIAWRVKRASIQQTLV